MGRDLHGHEIDTGIGHRSEKPLQLSSFGRRVGDRLGNPRDSGADRADQAHLLAGGPSDRLEQVGDRRLSVGAGDADNGHLCGRVAVDGGGERRHERPRVGDNELRNHRIDLVVDDESRRTCGDRGRNEVVSVHRGAAQRNEGRSRPDTA